jgi:vitamin B12 transporter
MRARVCAQHRGTLLMHHRPCHILLAIALAGLLPPLQAVETTAPVVVTATRTAASLDATLASAIVIDRATIEQSQARDVGELLRRHAGIDVVRSGGPGQATSVFIRGAESNHTLVLIDGVKINPGTIGIPSLQFIHPQMIERIEVVKGPRSTLYGSDAIGGVINIITRRPEQARSAQISATAGMYDTRELAVNVGAREGIWRIGADLAIQDTDGFPTRTDTFQDRGYDNIAYNLSVGARLGATDVELRRWQATGTVEYFATQYDPDTWAAFLAPVDQDFDNQTTALQVEHAMTASWLTRATLSTMQDEITQNQGNDFLRTRRHSLDWQNNLELGRHLLTGGITLWREKTATISYGAGFDEDTDINEIYLQDEMEFGAHQFLAGIRHTDHENFGTHTTWNLGYGLALSDNSHLFASAGTAFRAPDATDRFGYAGNPQLEAETSRSLEVGVRHRFNASTRGSLSLFDTRIDDLIEPNADFSLMENIQKARIRGLEIALHHTAGRWDTQLETSFQHPRNESRDEWLPRRARNSLTGRVGYRFGNSRLGAELLAAGKRKDSSYSDTVNAGYGIFNLLAETRLAPEFKLGARVENLFDREYSVADGYRTADRSFFLTLQYQPRL